MPWWFPTTSDVYKVCFATEQRVEQLHHKIDRIDRELDTLRTELADLITEGVTNMAGELEALKAQVAKIDAMGDELILKVQEAIDHTDAFSTAVFVLGPDRGMKLAKDLGVEAFIIDSNGTIYTTDSLKEKLSFEKLDSRPSFDFALVAHSLHT